MTTISEKNDPSSLSQTIQKYVQRPGNCAQVTLLAMQDCFRLDTGPMIRALAMYPSGAFCPGSICGSVTAAILALGLAYGKEPFKDLRGMVESTQMASEYCHRIRQELGGITCRCIEKAYACQCNGEGGARPEKCWRRSINHTQRCTRIMGICTKVAAEMFATCEPGHAPLSR